MSLAILSACVPPQAGWFDLGQGRLHVLRDHGTLQRPELTYENQNGTKIDRDRLAIVWSWKSATEAEIYVGVLPGRNATGIDTKIGVSLSSFRDENGNLFAAPAQADWSSILVKKQ